MHYVRRIAFLALLPVPVIAQERPLPPQGTVTEISLERTPGAWGTEPAYTVTLHASGLAVYQGHHNVPILGAYRSRIDSAAFARLADLLMQHGFFTMRDRYATTMTDQASTITAAVARGRRKAVENYARSGPRELFAIEHAIDTATARLRWRPAEPEPTPVR